MPGGKYQGVRQPKSFPGLPSGWTSDWETYPGSVPTGYVGKIPQLFSVTHESPSRPGLGHRALIVIHGMGTGAVRDAVRSTAAEHPLVKSIRPGQRGEGGDGATIVEF